MDGEEILYSIFFKNMGGVEGGCTDLYLSGTFPLDPKPNRVKCAFDYELYFVCNKIAKYNYNIDKEIFY